MAREQWNENLEGKDDSSYTNCIRPSNTSSLSWARSVIARPVEFGKDYHLWLSNYSPEQYYWNHRREIRLSAIPSILPQLSRKRFPMTPGTNAVWLIPIRLFVTSWMHIIIFLISSINLMFPFATLESWQRNSWMWCRKNKESKRGRDRTWRKSERREWKLWAFTGYLSFYLFCTEILLFGFVVSDIWEYEMPEWQKLMVETLSIQGPSSASASSSIFERYPVDWCLIAFSVHWLLHSDNELLGRHNPLVAAVRGLACDFWQLKREGTAPGSCSTFSLSESDNVQ